MCFYLTVEGFGKSGSVWLLCVTEREEGFMDWETYWIGFVFFHCCCSLQLFICKRMTVSSCWHDLVNFFLTCRTLWVDTSCFPSHGVSHWWTASTVSFLYALHTGVRHFCKKNSTAELLTVKGIQLLLIFSLGFEPPQEVINQDPAV